MDNKETKLYKKIMAGVPDNCRLFRNNTGQAYQGVKRRVKIGTQFKQILTEIRKIDFGLYLGSSDLIGYTVVEITPEMVGKKIAVFTAIEVKVGKNKTSEEQQNFLDQVHACGGIAGTVKSVEDAVKIVGM